MPAVRKVVNTTASLKTIIKQKQREVKEAQAIASALRTKKMFQDAAKSVTPCGRLYLQVGNACDEFSAGKLVIETPMDISDSIWAPWSIFYKKRSIFK